MSFDHDTPLHTEHTDILVPIDQYKDPITWDGNAAHIAGILHEIKKYYKRVGIFQPLLEHHAVALSNGKLAVDSVHTVSFIHGLSADPRSFDDPCPPTAERITKFNAAQRTDDTKIKPAGGGKARAAAAPQSEASTEQAP